MIHLYRLHDRSDESFFNQDNHLTHFTFVYVQQYEMKTNLGIISKSNKLLCSKQTQNTDNVSGNLVRDFLLYLHLYFFVL